MSDEQQGRCQAGEPRGKSNNKSKLINEDIWEEKLQSFPSRRQQITYVRARTTSLVSYGRQVACNNELDSGRNARRSTFAVGLELWAGIRAQGRAVGVRGGLGR